MPERQLARVVQHFRRMLTTSATTQTTDGDLLTRYVRQRDEQAFEALVDRHGPLVLGVCQRVLHNQADVEDAFQATFLVLVRKASSLRAPDRLANWLYGVACRAALQARNATLKRREKEAKAMVRQETTDDAWVHVRAVLDQELTRLPDKYREVIVLLELEGKTRAQVASLIGCPEGTVASRLARGRALLAKRLSRHVQILPASLSLAELTQFASVPSVPPSLISATVNATAQFTGNAVADGLISSKVVNLTQGVLKTMLMNKLMKIAALLLAVGFLVTGTGLGLVLAASRLPSSQEEEQGKTLVEAAKEEAAPLHVESVLYYFQNNEAFAEENFINKQVRVQVMMTKARIKRLQIADANDWGSSSFGQRPYYILVTSAVFNASGELGTERITPMQLVFGFGKDDQKKLAGLGQFSQVTIEGECLGRTTTMKGREIVCFKDCKVIKAEEQKDRGEAQGDP